MELQGTALCNLAEVLAAGRRKAEAKDALTRAVQLFERKGNVLLAGRARRLLTGTPAG
jgi:hypothetical protein